MRVGMRPVGLAVLGAFVWFAPAQADIVPPGGCMVHQASAADATAPKVIPNLAVGQEAMNQGNYILAVANFRPLAEDGDAVAQRYLGQLLMRGGCGVAMNKQEGVTWLRKAAEAHDVLAEFSYSQALLHGDGLPEDDKASFEWTKRAAKSGNAAAQTGVGYLYFTGRGVRRDPRQAIEWTVKAAEQGAPEALSNIAKSYLQGNGLPKDLRRAMFWICTAQQRLPPTQWALMQRMQQTRYIIARQLSVEEAKKIDQDSEKWSPGSGSLADVLADAKKWQADGSPSQTDGDVADH